MGFEPSALATTMSPYFVASAVPGFGLINSYANLVPSRDHTGVAAERVPDVSAMGFEPSGLAA